MTNQLHKFSSKISIVHMFQSWATHFTSDFNRDQSKERNQLQDSMST